MSTETPRPARRIVVVDAPDGATIAAVLGASSRQNAQGTRQFETVLAQQLPQATDADVLFIAEARASGVGLERTFVVTSASHRASVLTGVDVLAHLRGGATGVVDVAVLTTPETIEACALVAARDGGRLIVGEPALRLAEIYRMVREDWPSNDGHGDLDAICFRAGLALAQLERLRPLAIPGRKNVTMTAYAAALNAHAEETGFNYATDHLSRVLNRLGRLWTPAEELDPADLRHERGGLDRDDRPVLPHLARAHGFPRILPAIRGVPREEVGPELWTTLELMTEPEEERRLGTLVLRFRLNRARRIQGGE